MERLSFPPGFTRTSLFKSKTNQSQPKMSGRMHAFIIERTPSTTNNFQNESVFDCIELRSLKYTMN